MSPLRSHGRPLHVAELLSVGTELTVGETRDTNAGDLARDLAVHGVRVARIQALPDDLEAVTAAFADALGHVDLVVATGGLWPTPDDLTREAIAAATGETASIDPALEAWLRGLFGRRRIPIPQANLKQAWLIPSSVAIPNEHGTAPGWWVDRPDGRVVVALPGPPREMRPMWDGWVLPRLLERGLGQRSVVRVLRLAGIGESMVAQRLGDELLRAPNPIVATYARADAVDVRITATADSGRSADELADAAEAAVVARIGEHVWGRGSTTWADEIGHELATRGWQLAVVEVGTRGSLGALLGEGTAGLSVVESWAAPPDGATRAEDLAARARSISGAAVGLGARIRTRAGDTAVSIAVAGPGGIHREQRIVFLADATGRARAALAAADVLLKVLRASPRGRD